MEKILLIQFHRGNSIGEIEIEHLNNEGYFYYNFKKEALDNEIESKGAVFLVQFKDKNKENKIKQCCDMALGEYKELKITSENSKKGLLKIENIKPIKFNEKNSEIEETEKYKKIIEIINQIKSVELNDDATHNLVQIDIKKSKFKVLKQLAADADYGKENEKSDSKIVKAYDKLERKKTLCNLAQRSIYAKRVENKGDPRENRTEYQRDWERIIHSKSFRRLEDKAQIYTLAKGDHFRTRLTHTLEVTQIARGIARELNLNEDLVEAIALGHDLGHTPFGHAGERILNVILENEKVEGGFKHNFQGVKVVNYLEEKYGDFEGIDLTYQVMEGILKHTKTSDCKDCSQYDKENKTCNYWNPIEALECDKNHYQIKKFLCKGDVEKLHLKYNFSTTLEGQVVAVADEIAQRAHDLDDGIASDIIDEEKFLEDLDKDVVFKELKAKIDESLNYIKDDKRDYIDKLDIKRARIISDVITYFIAKIVERARSIIKEKENQIGDIRKKTDLVIDEEIIKFYDDIDIIRDRLYNITSKKIIESEGVKSFDEKGKYIIKELYKAYYEEPIKRMPKGTVKRISREIFRYMNDAVDISQDDRDFVDKEIEIYKKRMDDKNSGNLNEQDILKHKIFVRSIVDFISGMTDEFAIKQFKETYFPITYQI